MTPIVYLLKDWISHPHPSAVNFDENSMVVKCAENLQIEHSLFWRCPFVEMSKIVLRIPREVNTENEED